MKIIEQEKNIRVFIPILEFNTDADLQKLFNQGLLYDLFTERGEDEETEYKIIYFNSIEKDLMQLFLYKGYKFEWLKMANYPYAEYTKDTDVSNLNIYAGGVKENDTHCFTRIYKDSGHELNPAYPTNVEVQEWINVVGIDNIFVNPKTVEEKLKDYTEEEIV